jgi:hypothetical protein
VVSREIDGTGPTVEDGRITVRDGWAATTFERDVATGRIRIIGYSRRAENRLTEVHGMGMSAKAAQDLARGLLVLAAAGSEKR